MKICKFSKWLTVVNFLILDLYINLIYLHQCFKRLENQTRNYLLKIKNIPTTNNTKQQNV